MLDGKAIAKGKLACPFLPAAPIFAVPKTVVTGPEAEAPPQITGFSPSGCIEKACAVYDQELKQCSILTTAQLLLEQKAERTKG